MKNNDRILKYFSDQMTPDERDAFEKELSSSEDLRNESERIRQAIAGFKDTSEYSSSAYFKNLLPRVRERLDKKEKRGHSLKIAWALPAAAVIVLLIIINPFSPGGSNSGDFESIVSELNEDDKSTLLGEYTEMDQGNLRTVISSDEENAEKIDKQVSDVLFRTEESKSRYVDTDELVNDLSPQEAEEVYAALINKKIL